VNRFRAGLRRVESRPLCSTLVLAGFVLMVGSAYAVSRGNALQFADERDYVGLAQRLATSGRYILPNGHPTAFRPPLWPGVLALFTRLGVGVIGLRIVNVAFLSGTVVSLYAVVRRIGGVRAGLLAAMLLSVYPLAIYTATTLYPESLALFLVTIAVLATLCSANATRRIGSAGFAAAAGLAFAATAMTAPVYIIIALPSSVWLFNRLRCAGRRTWAPLLLAGVLLVGPAAWGLRNAIVLDEFVPLATNGGLNLLLGNSPDTTPTSGVRVDLSRYTREAARRHLGETARDRFYRDEAVDWILAHPRDAGVLYVGKFVNFFNFRNDLGTQGQASVTTDVVLAISYLPLLALFFLRLVLWRRVPAQRGEGYLVSSLFVTALALAVFFTRVRYRVPVDQLMLGVVAVGLVSWWDRQDHGLLRRLTPDPRRPLETRADDGHDAV
jgi:4-amino-4-deoxy-L-arabinose transferase-like glycosyltransferase